MKRYKVVAGSQTAHCCFDWTVIDTLTHKPDQGAIGVMCECFDSASAFEIAEALNQYEERRVAR
jgi:hypothetical protein